MAWLAATGLLACLCSMSAAAADERPAGSGVEEPAPITEASEIICDSSCAASAAPAASAAAPAASTASSDCCEAAPIVDDSESGSAVPVSQTAGESKNTADSVRLAQADVAPARPGGPQATPDAPGQPPQPGQPGQPAPPPLPVLLGYADFMLTIDRPWEAEKIYRGILRFDPKNAAALAGLRDVAQAKRPTFQALTHYYVDTHDVELFTYGGGPTFRFPWGRATITAGTGHYRNNNDPNNERNPLSLTPDIPSAEDNDTLRKSTLNLILEPIYKKWEGNFLVSRVTYDAAPDRTLFDLKISNVQSPRERYSVVYLRQDSFYQSQAQQFFAPENFFMVVDGITYHAVGGSIEYPLAPRLDFGSFGRYFRYSDGNERYNLRNYLFYRIKGDNRRPMPIFRAGIDVILDDSKFFTLDYSASEHFNAYSLAADYVWLSRRTKYIIYGSVPIGKENFEPPAALILSYRRKVSRGAEFYLNINGFVAPGVSISFGDYVLGFHKSF